MAKKRSKKRRVAKRPNKRVNRKRVLAPKKRMHLDAWIGLIGLALTFLLTPWGGAWIAVIFLGLGVILGFSMWTEPNLEQPLLVSAVLLIISISVLSTGVTRLASLNLVIANFLKATAVNVITFIAPAGFIAVLKEVYLATR